MHGSCRISLAETLDHIVGRNEGEGGDEFLDGQEQRLGARFGRQRNEPPSTFISQVKVPVC